MVDYESDFHFQVPKVAVLQLDFKIFPGLDPAFQSWVKGSLCQEILVSRSRLQAQANVGAYVPETLCFVSDSISPESIEGKVRHVPSFVSSTHWSPGGILAMWSKLRAFPRSGYDLYNRWRCARFVPIAIYWTIDGDSLRSPL